MMGGIGDLGIAQRLPRRVLVRQPGLDQRDLQPGIGKVERGLQPDRAGPDHGNV